ncbi:MAG: hypothetical protein AB8B62_13015 [Roseobacter sp.]
MTEKPAYDGPGVYEADEVPLRHFRESSEAMRRSEEAELSSVMQRQRAQSAVAQSRSLMQTVGKTLDDRETDSE